MMMNEKIDNEFLKLVELESELKAGFVPIQTEKDGNCLYHSIILQLTDDNILQDLVISLRLAIVFVILESEDYFENVLVIFRES